MDSLLTDQHPYSSLIRHYLSPPHPCSPLSTRLDPDRDDHMIQLHDLGPLGHLATWPSPHGHPSFVTSPCIVLLFSHGF